MPRKLFRKFLPSHESIRENRYVACFGPRLQHHNLWHLHRRSVAGGVAVGMFAGLVPGSNPVQFLVASLLAIGFRVNLPIAVAVTLYSNPLTVLPLYYAAFKLGQLALLRSDAELPSIALALEGKGFSQWIPAAFDWLAGIGYPLLVGLPLLALILALAGYLLVDWGWRLHVTMAWRRRHVRRELKRAQQAPR
ncbi:MAG: hypothetical protein JWO70_472 [Betaproteobacteria bacterium]|nr:hypothetical protein [Betaproteobacteria bacterium]